MNTLANLQSICQADFLKLILKFDSKSQFYKSDEKKLTDKKAEIGRIFIIDNWQLIIDNCSVGEKERYRHRRRQRDPKPETRNAKPLHSAMIFPFLAPSPLGEGWGEVWKPWNPKPFGRHFQIFKFSIPKAFGTNPQTLELILQSLNSSKYFLNFGKKIIAWH